VTPDGLCKSVLLWFGVGIGGWSDVSNNTDTHRLHCGGASPDRQAVEMQPAAICDAMSRADAARIGGMDRQTLRDWVHRFNADGPEGLLDRWDNGSVRRLSSQQLDELASLVETGPDPKTDGVVRWRRVDLKRLTEERFGVVYCERYVSQILHDLGFSHMSARPQHPRQDARVIAALKKHCGHARRAHSRVVQKKAC